MIPCGSQIMMSNGEHVQNTRMYGDFAVSVTYCGRMLEVVTHCLHAFMPCASICSGSPQRFTTLYNTLQKDA